MEEKLTPIKIKTWASRTVSGCLDVRVGGNQVHIGTSTTIRDRVFRKWNIPVMHWVVFPVGGKCEPWAIALDVMLTSGYVRRCILNKYNFHLWYFLEDLWMQMNEEQLGLLWRELSSSTPGRTLQAILEEFPKSKSESGLGQ